MIACIKPLLTSGEINQAWDQACEVFSRYDMPQELLELFRNYPPVGICPECGGQLQGILDPIAGSPWRMLPCESCGRRTLEKELPGILARRGLPPRFANARLSDFPKNIVRAIPAERGLYVWGPVGTGKTHLLCALLREEARRSGIVRQDCGELAFLPENQLPVMTSLQEILIQIRSSFGKNTGQDESETIDAFSKPAVLFLDDLGIEKATDWSMSMLFLLIDRRYRQNLKTFFSSNLSIAQLSERLGDRVSSRIAGMCAVIHLDGRDRRF